MKKKCAGRTDNCADDIRISAFCIEIRTSRIATNPGVSPRSLSPHIAQRHCFGRHHPAKQTVRNETVGNVRGTRYAQLPELKSKRFEYGDFRGRLKRPSLELRAPNTLGGSQQTCCTQQGQNRCYPRCCRRCCRDRRRRRYRRRLLRPNPSWQTETNNWSGEIGGTTMRSRYENTGAVYARLHQPLHLH